MKELGAATAMTIHGNGGIFQRPNTFLHPTSSPSNNLLSPGPGSRRLADDTELNIFDAERYFNEGNVTANGGADERCDLSSDPRASTVSSAEGIGRKSGSYQATPTASSEASWNSRSGLIANPPGSAAVIFRALPSRDRRRPPSSGARRFLARSCPCYGRKAVDVEERHAGPKSPPIGSPRESNVAFCSKKPIFRAGEVALSSIQERAAAEEFKDEFNAEEVIKVKITPGNWSKDRSFFNVASRFSPEKTFPAEIGHRIVNSSASGFSFPVLRPPPSSNVATEEPPRDSLEVFRPTEESAKIAKKPCDLQRRLTAVLPYPGEGERPSFSYPASPKPRLDDDAASDTSSDLFEIESLSTQMNFRRRDSLDELEGRRFVGSSAASEILQLRRSLEGKAPPSIAPSECYPPSEASVAWSVTTAEGFDRASAVNFSSAASACDFMEAEHERFAAAAAGGELRKSNGLLSCRCEKAVNVGPNPVRIGPSVELESSRSAKMGSANLVQERSGRTVHKT